MAIEKINFGYPKGTLQSVYDGDALTALELAAKTSKKVDECVEIVNGVEQTAIEATAIVDDMYVIQNQFVTDNSDTRAQLVNDNQQYLDGLTASKVQFEADLNTSKTQFVETLNNEVETIVNNADEVILTNVNGKIDELIIDGTIDNLINVDTEKSIVEATGMGIVSGLQVLQQTNPNMSVLVSPGTAHLWNGKRYNQTENKTINIDTADALYNRIDIVYINSLGVLSYGKGEAKVIPTPPTPLNSLILCEITVNTSTNSINTNSIADKRLLKKDIPLIDFQLSENAVVVTNLIENVDVTSIIQNTYNKLKKGQKLIIPSGTWLVNKLKFDKDDVEVYCSGTLKPLNANTEYVVMFGKGLPGQKTYRPRGYVKIDSKSDWFTYTGTACILYNVDESNLIVDIVGMTEGVKLIGDNDGCSYNKITVIKVVDCKKSVVVKGYGEGWANENIFYHGRYTNGSGKANYDDVVFFDIGDYQSSNFVADSIHFIHPSVEGWGKLCVLRGQGHKIENMRVEMNSYIDDFIEIYSNDTVITSLYDTIEYIGRMKIAVNGSQTSAGRITFNGVDVSGYTSFGNSIVLKLDDNSKLDCMCFSSSYSGGNTNIICNKPVPAGRTITEIEVTNVKNKGSNNSIKLLYEPKLSNGAHRLKNNGETLRGSSFFPSLMFNDNNASSDIALLINYIGANNLTVDYSGNIVTKGLIDTPTIKVGNRLTSYGSSAPTTGTYLRGDKVYNHDPIDTGDAGSKYMVTGWLCVAGGSPGTWKEMRVLTGA